MFVHISTTSGNVLKFYDLTWPAHRGEVLCRTYRRTSSFPDSWQARVFCLLIGQEDRTSAVLIGPTSLFGWVPEVRIDGLVAPCNRRYIHHLNYKTPYICLCYKSCNRSKWNKEARVMIFYFWEEMIINVKQSCIWAGMTAENYL